MPTASQTFYTLLTIQGGADFANAQAFKLHVPFTHLAVGDGGGQSVAPSETVRALVNETFRVGISSIAPDPDNPNWIIVEAVIPAQVGGWTIREIGLIGGLNQNNFAATPTTPGNKLLAYGNFPETYKPLLAEGAAKDLSIRMIIQVANAALVSLTVDPSVVVATKKNIEQALAGHNADGNAHANRFAPKSHLADPEAHPDLFAPKGHLTDPNPHAGLFAALTHLTDEAAHKPLFDAIREWALAAFADIGHLTATTPHAGLFAPLSHLDDPQAHKALFDALQSALQTQMNNIAANAVPAGSVFWFARATPPTGFLECNGAALSRTSYATLFSVIGTVFGAGDGSTTFNLPDLRGEFLRGWDHGRGVDAGRGFGSFQHGSTLNWDSNDDSIDMPQFQNFAQTFSDPYFPSSVLMPMLAVKPDFSVSTASTVLPRLRTARPRNRALLPCIKY